jgi:ABC-type Fe3+/spermidine/putrescine transport system ATPase subunit
MAACLQLEHLSKGYPDKPLLLKADFELQARARILLCGPSGSGKSTLLRLIAGLESPDEGDIRLAGALASSHRKVVIPPHRRQLAVVFQDLGLWPNLTVWANVMLGLSACKLSRADKRERASQALQLCHLMELARRRPCALSGGEQRRVALARALAVQPQLLLLDEPCNGLDLGLRHAFLRQVVELSEEMGTAVILVSHNLGDAQVIRGGIAVLENARLQTYQTLDQARSSSQKTIQHWLEAFGSEGLLSEANGHSGATLGNFACESSESSASSLVRSDIGGLRGT